MSADMCSYLLILSRQRFEVGESLEEVVLVTVAQKGGRVDGIESRCGCQGLRDGRRGVGTGDEASGLVKVALRH